MERICSDLQSRRRKEKQKHPADYSRNGMVQVNLSPQDFGSLHLVYNTMQASQNGNRIYKSGSGAAAAKTAGFANVF